MRHRPALGPNHSCLPVTRSLKWSNRRLGVKRTEKKNRLMRWCNKNTLVNVMHPMKRTEVQSASFAFFYWLNDSGSWSSIYDPDSRNCCTSVSSWRRGCQVAMDAYKGTAEILIVCYREKKCLQFKYTKVSIIYPDTIRNGSWFIANDTVLVVVGIMFTLMPWQRVISCITGIALFFKVKGIRMWLIQEGKWTDQSAPSI